jgi:mRNA-degrading endonuclease RelE of RelBE toxin-antitoxin system
MKVVFSDRAIEALQDAPSAVRSAFNKQIRFLADNLHHPEALQAQPWVGL